MATRLAETPIRCKYSVMMLKYDPSGKYAFIKEKLLVAKFFAKGDAFEYAIHRANSLPKEQQGWIVFEVETHNAIHCLYRAG